MHAPAIDSFMMLFTGRFIWVPMYIAIVLMLLKTFGWKLTGVYVLALALAITLTDQTCATIIRPIVARLRPSNPENPLSELAILVDGYRGGRYGFPSCHSANSFALATFVSCLIRRPRMIAFIIGWAVLNSYTRLYLGVHYPGDLLVGAAMGRPLFSIPTRLQLTSGERLSVGITVGDLMIGVGVATIFFIIVSSVGG